MTSDEEIDEMSHVPIVALDVDGVLNPRVATSAYEVHRYEGPLSGDDAVDDARNVLLSQRHGALLRELTDRGVELVWNTAWGVIARDWIAPRLNLPVMHVIEHAVSGVRFGHQFKLDALYEWAGDRPLAVLDDEFGGKDGRRMIERDKNVAPTIHVEVDPYDGLRAVDVDVIHFWLGRIGVPERSH